MNVCVRDTQKVKQRNKSSGLGSQSHVTYNVLSDSCGKVLEFKCKYELPIVDQLDWKAFPYSYFCDVIPYTITI